jgi:hypothetical protein
MNIFIDDYNFTINKDTKDDEIELFIINTVASLHGFANEQTIKLYELFYRAFVCGYYDYCGITQ